MYSVMSTSYKYIIQENMNISVAMATYNGEKFIREQIESILKDLKDGDELIISDDHSQDDTLNIIHSLMDMDDRIHLLDGPGKGVVKNFEYVLKFCKNDIICLSDQDDIWLEGKREKIVSCFANQNVELITHNSKLIDKYGDSIKDVEWVKMRHGVLRNLIKSCYFGCCMSFRRNCLQYILPFPSNLNAHDQYIGVIFEKRKTSFFIDDVLLKHRLHGNNFSQPLSLINKIKFRIVLISCYLHGGNR